MRGYIVKLSLHEQPFVEAMQAAGAGIPPILFRHIMPNTLAPLLVQATYICAYLRLGGHCRGLPQFLRCRHSSEYP